MTFQEIKKMLNEGNVKFVFTKKDGTEREAYGTTKLDNIPEESHPKGVGTESSSDQVRYFDLDKNAWRSFNFANFVKVL